MSVRIIRRIFEKLFLCKETEPTYIPISIKVPTFNKIKCFYKIDQTVVI